MAKNKKDESPLSGFNELIGNISSNVVPSDTINLDSENLDADDDDNVVDLSIKEKKEEDAIPSEKDEKDDDAINDDSSAKDDETEEEKDEKDDLKDNKKSKKKDIDFSDEEDEETIDDDKDAESSQVGLFFDAFSESLGWEVDDEDKPSTIDGLIEYMRDVIDENSVPEYADDKVKELDEFVRNGGKFEDYYRIDNQLADLDNIDIENEDIQKQVCKDWLKVSGYTDTQIDRKIQRWEEAGVLEDEANDNLELLKTHRDNEKKELIKEQEKTRINNEKVQKAFFEDVTSNIDNLKEIRGIKIPVDDRKKLKDYAFKIESDGTTKFQKDYNKNLAKNFIESAYFTMKGDAFVKTAKQAGESSAVSKLKASMKNRAPGNSKQDIENSSATPIWKAASSFLGVK